MIPRTPPTGLVDMAKVTQMLDNGWNVKLFRNGLGSYTATAIHHNQEIMERLQAKNDGLLEFVDDDGEVTTDDFTPAKSLTRLAYKVHGEVLSTFCECPEESGELDQRKISRILGSTMLCRKCGKQRK